MEKQVKVVDEETFNEALELMAEGPVNISSPTRSWFNINDADESMRIVGDLLVKGVSSTVEAVQPKQPGVEFNFKPVHHIPLREYECPGCRIRTKDFDTFFAKEKDERGTEWVNCKKCGWHGSEMLV